MSTGTIMVTATVVRNKANELRALNQQLKSKVDDMVRCETGLTKKWKGEAKDAFHAAFNQDRICWDDFRLLIDDYAKALDLIADEYAKREAANVSIASTRKK